MQIDFFKIGMKQFTGITARRKIRKMDWASFVMLSVYLKDLIRDAFVRVGMNPSMMLNPEDKITTIIRHIGVWSCRR